MKIRRISVVSICLIMIVLLSGCAKEMKTIKEKKSDVDLSKIINTEETEKKLVDIKSTEESTTFDEEILKSATLELVEESVEETGVEKIENIKSTEEDTTQKETYAELVEEKEEDCIERHFTVEEALAQDYFKYGKAPCKWVYIAPNKQIISNYKPKSSELYSIRKKATSGSKGCFLPILSQTNNANDDYEARFLCFDDTKNDIESFRFLNKAKSLEYRGLTIETILEKGGFQLEELSNGVLKVVDSGYINIIYIDDLDKILGIEE